MSEHLVVDVATNRLINWVLGVGSVVTGSLLVFIGSQTFTLAKSSAVISTQLTSINKTLDGNGQEIRANGREINALAGRVAALEYADPDRQQQ